MNNSFDKRSDINVVSPDNPCDICGLPAGFYSVLYYVHICSEKCYDTFEQKMNEEVNRMTIIKLNPDGEKK